MSIERCSRHNLQRDTDFEVECPQCVEHELQIEDLGFTLNKEYTHDQFHTRRYKKDFMLVEFTYDSSGLKTQDLTIDELIGKELTIEQLRILSEIL